MSKEGLYAEMIRRRERTKEAMDDHSRMASHAIGRGILWAAENEIRAARKLQNDLALLDEIIRSLRKEEALERAS